MDLYPAPRTACHALLTAVEHSLPLDTLIDSPHASQLTVRIHAFAVRLLGALVLPLACAYDLSVWVLKTVTVIFCKRELSNHLIELAKIIAYLAYAIVLPFYLVRQPLHRAIIDLRDETVESVDKCRKLHKNIINKLWWHSGMQDACFEKLVISQQFPSRGHILQFLLEKSIQLNREGGLRDDLSALIREACELEITNPHDSSETETCMFIFLRALINDPKNYWNNVDIGFIYASTRQKFRLMNLVLRCEPQQQEQEILWIQKHMLSQALYNVLFDLPKNSDERPYNIDMATCISLLEREASLNRTWGRKMGGVELLLFLSAHPLDNDGGIVDQSFWRTTSPNDAAFDEAHHWKPQRSQLLSIFGRPRFFEWWYSKPLEAATFPSYFTHYLRLSRHILHCNASFSPNPSAALISLPALKKAYEVMNDCCQIALDTLQPNLPLQPDTDPLSLIDAEIERAYKQTAVIEEAATQKHTFAIWDPSRFKEVLKTLFGLSPFNDHELFARRKTASLCQNYCRGWLERLPELNSYIQESNQLLVDRLVAIWGRDFPENADPANSPLADKNIVAIVVQFLIGAPEDEKSLQSFVPVIASAATS